MPLPPVSPAATALVTGASSGIGAAIAVELAQRGHGVTLVARRAERLSELAERLESDGVRAEAIGCDLTDPEERDLLQAEIEDRGLAVEVLVNNAGFGTSDEFHGSDRAALVQMVRLNVEAVVDLASRWLPGMVRRERGAVLNVASTAAFQPLPGGANYAASKAFVLSLSEALSSEVGGDGVTVTALCPGPVKTEFAEVAGVGGAERRTPDLIWSSPEQVAAAAVRGVEQGKRVVVPGVLNQAGALGGRFAPHAVALPVIRRIWRSARN
ncbi:MAG: SDR family NAD(P)-dependent oxidoreductase [Solirubrobacterales bacterium]